MPSAPRRKPIRRSQTQTNQTEPDDDEEEDIIEEGEQDATTSTDETDQDETAGDEPETEQVTDTPDQASQADSEPLEPLRGAPRDGRSYRMGEKVVFKGVKRGGTIVVSEPVYRAVKSPGTDRWRYHLLLARGSSVGAAKVRELESGEYESTHDLTH